MPSIEEKLHAKIAQGLADTRLSPAVLAYKMKEENKYVNESMLQYIVNYVLVMADSKFVPTRLEEINKICQVLKISLEELGLTGMIGRRELDMNEYIQVG